MTTIQVNETRNRFFSRIVQEIMKPLQSMFSSVKADTCFRIKIARGELPTESKLYDDSPRNPDLLIIDHDENYRQVIKDLLKGTPYLMAEARDGRQGLQLARTLQPRIVIIDPKTPGLNGSKMFGLLRKDPKTRNIEVIFNSSKPMWMHDLNYRSSRPLAILHKDFPSRKEGNRLLLATLRAAGIGQSKIEEELPHAQGIN